MNKEIMIAMGFEKEIGAIENGKCPMCKQGIVMGDFKTPMDLKEHNISGLCQNCIDSVFGE